MKHLLMSVMLCITAYYGYAQTLPQQIIKPQLEVDPIASGDINSDFVLGCDWPNTTGYYCHGDYLDLKYGFPYTNPRTNDHSPGAFDYNMLIFDGFLTDGHVIWEQPNYVFDDLVKYNFSFWAHNRFFSGASNAVEIELYIGGVYQETFTIQAQNGWQQFNHTIPFFANHGTTDITLVQKNGGHAQDFALDDIFMGWQPYNMEPQTLYMDSINLMNPHLQRDPHEEAYYIAGSAVYSATSSKLYVIKVDRFGQPIWSYTYKIDNSPDARCYGFTYNPSGQSFLLTGYYLNQNGWRNPYVLEIGLNGNIINQKQIEMTPGENGIALDIIVDEKDNIVLGGFADPTPVGDLGMVPASIEGLVIQLDQNLSLNWTKKLSTSQQLCPYINDEYMAVSSVTETSAGYFLTGSISEVGPSGKTTQGVLNRTINQNGQFVWDRSYHHVQNCSTIDHRFAGSDAMIFKGELISTNNSSNWHSMGYNKQMPVSGVLTYNGMGASGINHNWSNQIMSAINGKDIIVAGINSDIDVPVVRSIDPVSGNVNWTMEYVVQNNTSHFHTFGQTDPRLQPFGMNGYFQAFEYSDLMTIEPNAGFYTPNGSYMLVANRCDGPGQLIGLEFFELTENGDKSVNTTDCAVNELSESFDPIPMDPRFVMGNMAQLTDQPIDASYGEKVTTYGSCTNGAPSIPNQNGKRALSVNDVEANYLFEVFPNPVKDNLTVKWESELTVDRIEVMNLTGQVLMVSQVNSGQTSTVISLSHLPSSVYLVQLIDSNGQRQIQRIAKQ